MKLLTDQNLRRDFYKVLALAMTLLGFSYLFIWNPTLSAPTLSAIVVSMILSPMVAMIERRGHPRALAITILFILIGIVLFVIGAVAVNRGISQWDQFREAAPEYFNTVVQKVQALELRVKTEYPFLKNIHPSKAIVNWGRQTGEWFVNNGAALVGDILTWMFIVPILSFFLLSDGPNLRRRFFQMVPNRFFETTFGVVHEITTSISDYLRAKLVEALLVGLMVTLGLAIIDNKYAIVLGVLAGVTNILPYVGPIIGAVPGLLIVGLGTDSGSSLGLTALVYVIANVIDTVLIFPVIVAKLVDLHPVILIVAVMIGQEYYGLVGMLISIPIASAIKVVVMQIYRAVYDQSLSAKVEAKKNRMAAIPFISRSGSQAQD
ncbi:MAG: AI-2E family transporter [Bdellovibrionales bacterium]|nr:AI-2E family transporter [Bdellovibrionales bacterium]